MNTNHYNPKIHHRRSIRLSGYDYSQEGAYFITICCQDKVCRFGTVENDKMMLNECGLIAANEWIALPNRFINIEVDVFQIMPNHIHGIIIVKDVGATLAVAQSFMGETAYAGQPQGIAPTQVVHGTIPAIIGAYKSLVSNGCLKIYKSKNKPMGKLWQRNYYEHIIRNEQSYRTISQYVTDNPAKWAFDKLFTV